MALRGLTKSTGILHEAQVLNLKYWPRIALPHSIDSVCAYDAENKIVEFRMKFGKKKPPSNLKTRMQGLSRSVKDLLGPEHSIVIKDGKKVLFKSDGIVPRKANG